MDGFPASCTPSQCSVDSGLSESPESLSSSDLSALSLHSRGASLAELDSSGEHGPSAAEADDSGVFDDTSSSSSSSSRRSDVYPQGYSRCGGVNYPPLVKPESLSALRSFAVREDDVFLCTFVKSGTTWMQQILRLLANKGQCDPGRTVNDDVPYLEESDPNRLACRKSPRLIKTHLTYELTPKGDESQTWGTAAKYIYIMRNPRDVAVSLFYHTRAFQSYKFDGDWDAFFEVFYNGDVDYGQWFDHVMGWWSHRHDDNLLILTYEDMQKDLATVIRKVIEFLEWDHVTDDVIARTMELSSFKHMRADKTSNYSWDASVRRPGDVPFMRKGEVGDWLKHFSAEQRQRFDSLYDQHIVSSDFPALYRTQ